MSTTTSNLSRSLEYRLWQLLYAAGWANALEGIALPPRTGNGIPANSYGTTNGFPWSWWDAQVKNPGYSALTVYRNGHAVNPATYAVNFLDGYVTFKAASTGEITADITQFAVNLVEGYPEDDRLESTELPIVAYTIDGKQGVPFSVGTPYRDYTSPTVVDILANNKVQVKDLMDDVVRRIIVVPLLDCDGAWLLGKTGDVDPNFNFDLQIENWMRIDPDPRGTILAPRHNGSAKERYRAMVTVGLKIVE